MTDAAERRLAEIMAEMNDMLESRLPDHLPKQRPDWQIWIFIAGVLFYAGISWVMVQQNSAAIEKILIEHKTDIKIAAGERSGIEDALIGHINDENTRNLARSEQIRKSLEQQIRNQH